MIAIILSFIDVTQLTWTIILLILC